VGREKDSQMSSLVLFLILLVGLLFPVSGAVNHVQESVVVQGPVDSSGTIQETQHGTETKTATPPISVHISSPANHTVIKTLPGLKPSTELSIQTSSLLSPPLPPDLILTIQLDAHNHLPGASGPIQSISLQDHTDNLDVRADVHSLIPGSRSVEVCLVSGSGEDARTVLTCEIVFLEVSVEGVPGEGGSETTVSKGNAVDVGASIDIAAHTAASGDFDRRAYFEQVYRYKIWSGGGAMGADSGPGSNMGATDGVRGAIRSLVNKGGISRIVDVPCGDMTWMEIDFLMEKNVTYLGMDVAETVVKRNEDRFRHLGGQVEFRHIDVVADSLPPLLSTDLILVRHLMFHLPPRDNLRIIEKLQGTGAGLVAMTTYLRADENHKEFIFAYGHEVNLFRDPYCMRDPSLLVKDYKFDMFLGVWDRRGGSLELVDKGGCLEV